jgi:glycosyl hydrolase family 42 (putative beta-galactosidase)
VIQNTYMDSGIRLEARDAYNPPDKKHVDRLVDDLLETGIKAVWHSAVDRSARPLFPSKIFPNCHQEASTEDFRYLTERMHEINCSVISWYPLHLCIGLAEKHPDWLMKPIPWSEYDFTEDKEKRHCCINSPYGEMLPEFLAEVVVELGFDGIWMDGTTFAIENENPGCICNFCREKFIKETNLKIPEKVDFENHDFRVWVNWRYDILMKLWENITTRLNHAKPGVAICFNNYRRRKGSSEYHPWSTGIPMRPLCLDAIMSSELEGFPGQADIQMKINRAYECKHGVESWWPLSDGYGFVPDADPLPGIQAALGCITAGGVASTGTFPEKRPIHALKAMNRATSTRLPYVNGKSIEYAAILASQQTMDFFGKENPHVIWNQIHGANEVMRHSHLQTSVIFDAHLTHEELQKYKVVIIGNAACLSEKQAEALSQYTKKGGVLVSCSNVGEYNEMGSLHPTPVLDELFGIIERNKSKCGHTLTHHVIDKDISKEIGEYISFRIDLECTTSDNIETLVKEQFSAIWRKKHGKGWSIYITGDLFEQYLKAPVPRIMKLIKCLLTDLATPTIELSAPMCVTVNTREIESGKWAVHLHNAPGSTYANPYHPRNEFIGGSGEVNPLYDLQLKVNEHRIQTAKSALTGETYEILEHSIFKIPKLELHDIILLEVKK